MTIEMEASLAQSQSVASETEQAPNHHPTDFIESLHLDSLTTQLDTLKNIIFNTSVPDNAALECIKKEIKDHSYHINSKKIAQKFSEQTEALVFAELD